MVGYLFTDSWLLVHNFPLFSALLLLLTFAVLPLRLVMEVDGERVESVLC